MAPPSDALPANPQPPLTPAQLQAAARALGTAGGSGTELLTLLYDPDVDLGPVLKALNREPALAARVLKVANSPFYRASGSVGTLERAVSLLGLTAIRGIAAAGCLDRLAPSAASGAFHPRRFRTHSLAVAVAAQHYARAAQLPFAGEAFMAGLLHDIGVLVLAKAAPAAMARFDPEAAQRDAAGDGLDALAVERAALGATHEEAAGALAASWALPAWLQAAATGHHAHDRATGPATAEDSDALGRALPALLALGNEAACRAGFGLWPACDSPAPEGTLASLGLDASAPEAVLALLPEAVTRLAGE